MPTLISADVFLTGQLRFRGVGLCFMPLNMIIMTGMGPRDAGAGSGLLQAMQRVGGSLGVAVLVTVYGTAMKHSDRIAGLDPAEQAKHVLTDGVVAAFTGAAAFAVFSFLVTLVAVSQPRPERDA
jgi:hypothetical protein